jgi:hypothetical protein
MSGRAHVRLALAPFFAMVSLIQPATAQTGRISTPSQRRACTEFAFSIYAVTMGRDHGTPKSEIVDLNAKVEKEHVLPSQAIDDVFEYKKLKPVDLYLYWRWECDARARNIPIASLGSVADRIGPCFQKTGDVRVRCVDSIRRALRLPEDIYPSVSEAIASHDEAPKR